MDKLEPNKPKPHSLREHRQMTDLLEKLPRKAQHGLWPARAIMLTALDADEAYIALGSNVGTVFLYNRDKGSFDRLKFENFEEVVSCVNLHKSLEHQVAVGTESGAVYLFQLPSALPNRKSTLQKFSLTDIHSGRITSLCWSTNGMKLFSGDSTGLVMQTDVDFQEGQCASLELLKEDGFEIVQLDYSQRVCLVSTTLRTVVCRTDQNNDVLQVGQKERKCLGNFGASFIAGICKTDDLALYAARPGQRLWKATVAGVVQSTIIFKDMLMDSKFTIPVLHEEGGGGAEAFKDFSLGKLLTYCETNLLTWNDTCLCVLNPSKNTVIATQSRLGHIDDIATVGEEIFVLRKSLHPCVLRLATRPLPSDEYIDQYSISRLNPRATKDSHKEESLSNKLKERSRSPLRFFLNKVVKPNASGTQEDVVDNHKVTPIYAGLERNEILSVVIANDVQEIQIQVSDQVQSNSEQHLGENAPMKNSRNQNSDTTEIETVPPIVSISKESVSKLIVYDYDKTVPETVDPIPAQTEDNTNDIHSIPGQFQSSGEQRKDYHREDLPSEQLPQPLSLTLQADVKDDDFNSIVFSAKPKKGKKKKKHKAKQLDTISTSSRESGEGLLRSTSSANDDFSFARTTSSTSGEYSIEPLSVTGDDFSLLNGANPESLSFLLVDGASSYTSMDMSSQSLQASPGLNDQVSLGLDVSDKSRSSRLGNTSSVDRGETIKVSTSSGAADIGPFLELQPDSVISSDSIPSSIGIKTGEHSVIDHETVVNKQLQDSILSLNLTSIQEPSGSGESNSVTSPVSPGFYRTNDSSKTDIYGHNVSLNKSSSSDTSVGASRPGSHKQQSSHRNKNSESPAEKVKSKDDSDSNASDGEFEAVRNVIFDSWGEFNLPSNVTSLSLSKANVYFTDSHDNVYTSPLNTPGLRWRKLDAQAKQIAVSPSGNILWRMHKGGAFAALHVSPRRPEGTKWTEVARDVICVAVGDTSAWYVKSTGEVKIQKGLSKDRPVHTSHTIPCKYRIQQIVCRMGVIWAVTDDLELIVRVGVTEQHPQGNHWLLIDKIHPRLVFAHIALGADETGWAVDVVGRIWFCSGVTKYYPAGDQKWWQVSLSEYFTQDQTALDKLKSLAGKFDPQRLTQLFGSQQQQQPVIAAGVSGTWYFPGTSTKNVLQVCKGSMTGHAWEEAQPQGIASTTVWKLIDASLGHRKNYHIWAQQPNKDLFAFSGVDGKFSMVSLPYSQCQFASISVCSEAVWGLTAADGKIFVRAGMTSHCPLGVNWIPLDLSQLGGVSIVSLSCGKAVVWAVDVDGMVYHRIGVQPPSTSYLSPVWLSIDTSKTCFTHIQAGPEESMVWAIDNRNQVFVRIGISDTMPIGTAWVQIPGLQVVMLAISRRYVWALSPTNEIYCRHGIQPLSPAGDYWRKIPGIVSFISASYKNQLWGINLDGQLVKRDICNFIRQHQDTQPLHSQCAASPGDDAEWEIINPSC